MPDADGLTTCLWFPVNLNHISRWDTQHTLPRCHTPYAFPEPVITSLHNAWLPRYARLPVIALHPHAARSRTGLTRRPTVLRHAALR